MNVKIQATFQDQTGFESVETFENVTDCNFINELHKRPHFKEMIISNMPQKRKWPEVRTLCVTYREHEAKPILRLSAHGEGLFHDAGAIEIDPLSRVHPDIVKWLPYSDYLKGERV